MSEFAVFICLASVVANAFFLLGVLAHRKQNQEVAQLSHEDRARLDRMDSRIADQRAALTCLAEDLGELRAANLSRPKTKTDREVWDEAHQTVCDSRPARCFRSSLPIDPDRWPIEARFPKPDPTSGRPNSNPNHG